MSASILPNSLVRHALNKATRLGSIITSQKVFEEYTQVLFRDKFDKYFISVDERFEIFNLVETKMLFFLPTETFTDCRDHKDNNFLELAIAAQASCIITGDNNLVVLHPFRNIPILNAVNILKYF